jgi:hypothetical protein
VGAWWVGFIACGIIIFLAGIPLLFFPRHLPVPKYDPEKRRKKEAKRANKEPKKRPFADSPMMMGGGGGGDGDEEKIDIKGRAASLIFIIPFITGKALFQRTFCLTVIFSKIVSLWF